MKNTICRKQILKLQKWNLKIFFVIFKSDENFKFFGQLNFQGKTPCWIKYRIISKFWFFHLNLQVIFSFCKKTFLDKIFIFLINFNFLFRNFGQKFRLWKKFQFWTKTSILDNNFNFGQKFQFWTTTSILDNNFNFRQKFQFWTKISVLDKNFIFSQKIYSKIRNNGQNICFPNNF